MVQVDTAEVKPVTELPDVLPTEDQIYANQTSIAEEASKSNIIEDEYVNIASTSQINSEAPVDNGVAHEIVQDTEYAVIVKQKHKDLVDEINETLQAKAKKEQEREENDSKPAEDASSEHKPEKEHDIIIEPPKDFKDENKENVEASATDSSETEEQSFDNMTYSNEQFQQTLETIRNSHMIDGNDKKSIEEVPAQEELETAKEVNESEEDKQDEETEEHSNSQSAGPEESQEKGETQVNMESVTADVKIEEESQVNIESVMADVKIEEESQVNIESVTADVTIEEESHVNIESVTADVKIEEENQGNIESVAVDAEIQEENKANVESITADVKIEEKNQIHIESVTADVHNSENDDNVSDESVVKDNGEIDHNEPINTYDTVNMERPETEIVIVELKPIQIEVIESSPKQIIDSQIVPPNEVAVEQQPYKELNIGAIEDAIIVETYIDKDNSVDTDDESGPFNTEKIVIIMKDVGVQAPDIYIPLDIEKDFGYTDSKLSKVDIGIQVETLDMVDDQLVPGTQSVTISTTQS